MNLATLRGLMAGGIGLSLVLFVAVIWDYFGNEGDWGVVLVILLAVLLLVMLLLSRLSYDEEELLEFEVVPAPEKKAAAYYDYKGDIHDVIDIEGIGPVYAEKLHAAGIKTTARLSYARPEKVAKVTGAPLKTARHWHQMAELMKVNGIGMQYAEVLVRAGVTGIQELKDRDAKAIAEQVNKYLATLEVNVLGQPTTQRRIAGFQKKAKPMRKVRQAVPKE